MWRHWLAASRMAIRAVAQRLCFPPPRSPPFTFSFCFAAAVDVSAAVMLAHLRPVSSLCQRPTFGFVSSQTHSTLAPSHPALSSSCAAQGPSRPARSVPFIAHTDLVSALCRVGALPRSAFSFAHVVLICSPSPTDLVVVAPPFPVATAKPGRTRRGASTRLSRESAVSLTARNFRFATREVALFEPGRIGGQ